ncbi:MAG: urea ABC transporter ATP-binding subunit UrtE [Lachnospiraceae bacterium]
MLQLKNVSAYYGESKIIDDLSIQVPDGEIVCQIGRNGVGKTTTLKSIMGLVKTPTGEVLFEDRDVRKIPTYDRVKLGIGYVPQGRDIFPQMTVAENLELGLQPLGGKGKVPEYLYDLFPDVKRFLKRKGGDLSGGQQQQLAIARAMAAEPKLLILDEPTEGIQPSIIQDIGTAIGKINEWKKTTILIVEQYLEFVLEISNFVYVMEKGKVLLSGKTEDLDAGLLQRAMTTGTVEAQV